MSMEPDLENRHASNQTSFWENYCPTPLALALLKIIASQLECNQPQIIDKYLINLGQ
jgi:hypothetical protein